MQPNSPASPVKSRKEPLAPRIFGGTCEQPPPLPEHLTPKGFIWWAFWGQRRWMLGATLIGVSWMGLHASLPALAGMAVGRGIRGDSWATLWPWIASVMAASLTVALGWVARHRLALGIHIRTQAWMERVVAQRILEPLGGLESTTTPGQLVSTVAVDGRNVAHCLDIVSRLAGATAMFVVILAFMFKANWLLATSVLASLIPMLLTLLWRLRKLAKRSHRVQAALAEAGSTAADSISGIRIVKGLGGELEAIRRYQERSADILEQSVKAAATRAGSFAFDTMMPIVVVMIVGWVGGTQAAHGNLGIDDLVTFSGWAVFLLIPLRVFSEAGRKWATAQASAARIVNLLNLPLAIDDKGTYEGPLKAPSIEFTNATKAVDDVEALDRMSLAFQPHLFTAIVADQRIASTFTACLGRSTDLDAGSIRLGGVDVRHWTLHALRQVVVVAEHDGVLFAGSLRHNLRVANPSATDDEMLQALERAAATDIVELLDRGLDGAVLERGRSLSGGQRQRVALARAYLADPPILVLVDPTSALDSYTESEIVDRLVEFRKGKTTIVFTSSPALLGASGEVVMLGPHGPTRRGSHEELMESCADYRSLILADGDEAEDIDESVA